MQDGHDNRDVNRDEIWAPVPVPAFKDHYEVSNRGRVRRTMPARGASVGKALACSVGGPGYPTVKLHANNAGALTCNVHDLVAGAFLGPKPDGMHVNHIDHQRTNNASENIEYVTPGENVRHAARAGRMGVALSQNQARQILRRSRDGERNVDLAAEYGVCPDTVWHIKSGRTWPHLQGEDAP